MSQENVELVRRAVEAFNRRDFAALADYSHEELEFVSVIAAVDGEGAAFSGREIWVNYFAVMDETWDGWQVADLQVWDAGNDQVAAIMHMRGTGKQSGAPIDQEVGIAYRFRAGKLWRMRSYLDPDEALNAVGLRE
jgi:ketosteroid isomerase-like protein